MTDCGKLFRRPLLVVLIAVRMPPHGQLAVRRLQIFVGALQLSALHIQQAVVATRVAVHFDSLVLD